MEARMRALTRNKRLLQDEGIVNAVLDYASEVEERVMEAVTYYPPYEAISYIRTGNLGYGWDSYLRHTMSGIYLTFNNDVPYAPYVQGENQQPIFREIGWNRFYEVIEDERRDWRPTLQRIVKENLKMGK